MPYPGVYRAKAARVDGNRLTAFVPQVFGETSVMIVDFVGPPPTAAEMGWVSFHGGHPEYPVWLGTGTGGGTGTVTDVLWVGPNPPVDPTMELWWDTDEPPQGGGNEEVYIGAEPPGAGYELWYDTDADAPLTIDQRWNTAWGTIAVGTLNPMSGTSITAATNISSPLTVTLLAGRRYEFEACVHATAGTTGTNGFNLRFNGLPAANDTWNAVTPSAYGQGRILTPVVGTGAAVTVTLQGYVEAVGKPVSLYTSGSAASFFVCRDVGPTTLVPAPPPPDWTMYDARYANPGPGVVFTPTITSGGFTLGTGGSITARYWRLGKGDSLDLIYYTGRILFGTSPTNGSSLFVSLPVGCHTDGGLAGRTGYAEVIDVSSSGYFEAACSPGGTNLWLLDKVVSGIRVVHANMASGNPIVFAVNDTISWAVWYPAV